MNLIELNKTSTEVRQILVFRSNIDNAGKVITVCRELEKIDAVHRVNVDLGDWEYVLRVECGPEIPALLIEEQVARLGFLCSEL